MTWPAELTVIVMSNATPALGQDAGFLERLSAVVFGPRGAYAIAVAATLAVAGLRWPSPGALKTMPISCSSSPPY